MRRTPLNNKGTGLNKGSGLKRGASLKKGGGLNRGQEFQARSHLKSETKMRKRSNKMKEIYKERRKIVADMITVDSACMACQIWYTFDTLSDPDVEEPCVMTTVLVADDVHELVNRSQGGSILDIRNLVAVCRPCHTRITDNPMDSISVGLHIPGFASHREDWLEAAEEVRESLSSGRWTVIETSDDWKI